VRVTDISYVQVWLQQMDSYVNTNTLQ